MGFLDGAVWRGGGPVCLRSTPFSGTVEIGGCVSKPQALCRFTVRVLPETYFCLLGTPVSV